ncbi:helix-turn-helix domain-containing protein [Aestuariimicrobium soli]|uniref:AraC family transcriptional regulator n=1 Tax=Aestuariimicrobium soli TaxID=2035834 RepID=UPI003EB839FA
MVLHPDHEALGQADVSALIGRLTATRIDGCDVDFTDWGFYPDAAHGGVPWRNWWHRHSYYEVCLAYAGAGEFRHGDEVFTITPGQVFLARPGVLHEIESSTDDPLGIAFWGLDLVGSLPVPMPAWALGLDHGPVVSTRVGSLPALVSALAAEARSPRSGAAGVLRALGAALVVETGRAFAAPDTLAVEPPPRDRGEQQYRVMVRYLRDNLGRPVAVRDVAAAVHLSERHAERLFRQQAGESLMVTLRRLRVERAAGLLRDGDDSVTDVAARVGYLDVASFRAAFREVLGQSPSEYRRTNGTVHRGAARQG